MWLHNTIKAIGLYISYAKIEMQSLYKLIFSYFVHFLGLLLYNILTLYFAGNGEEQSDMLNNGMIQLL